MLFANLRTRKIHGIAEPKYILLRTKGVDSDTLILKDRLGFMMLEGRRWMC